MTIHIQKFVDRLQGTEARGLKDFSMSTADAKMLRDDITRLLLNLQILNEKLGASGTDQVITVELGGGSF